MSTKILKRDKGLNDLYQILDRAFDVNRWGENQMKCYMVLRSYIDKHQSSYHRYEHRNDKNSVMDNVVGQAWYIRLDPSLKNIVTRLVDQLTIVENYCHNTVNLKILNLEIVFVNTKLTVKYYQSVGDLISLQIYVSNQQKKNFLAYYTKGRLLIMPEDIKNQIKVPELSDLNQLMSINENLLPAKWLFVLFIEIVLYFDQTESIGKLKLMDREDEKTIIELMELAGSISGAESAILPVVSAPVVVRL